MVTNVASMQTHTTSESVAHAVTARLKEAGLPQRTVAAETGIPIVTLSRRLTGKSSFTVHELDLIADLLGTDVATLITTPVEVA